MVCGRHLASPILLRGCEIKSGGGVPVPRLDLPAYMPLPPTFQAHSEKTTLSDSNKILLYPYAIHWPPKHCCKHTASHNVFFVYVVRVSNSTRKCARTIKDTLLRSRCGWNLHFAFMRGSLWAIAQVHQFSPTTGRWRCEEGRRQPINWHKSTGSGTMVRYGSRYSVAAV